MKTIASDRILDLCGYVGIININYELNQELGWLSRICLPMQETRVQSLHQEDPLGKEMATHSSILAGKIPWTEEPGRLQSMGLQKSWT